MNYWMQARESDSPYVAMIWNGLTGPNYTPTCPADERWHILFSRYNDKVEVCLEGPLSRALYKTQPEGVEWLVVAFKLGVFMPELPVNQLVDSDQALPEASCASFWLNSATWQFPDFNNVETFVERMARDGLLVNDPVVNAVLQNQPQDISERTVRRRFLRATGLTQGYIRQIERARFANTLLAQGVPILDAVYEAGYADQPHMTRSLKHFIGHTPAQIAQVSMAE